MMSLDASPRRDAPMSSNTHQFVHDAALKARFSEQNIVEEKPEPLDENPAQYTQEKTTTPGMSGAPEKVRPASVRESSPLINKATLYEDGSHVIDYNSESGTIDASLTDYKNIKRIGSGHIIVEKGGINFYRKKKLYRYDFHRITDIKSGGKFMALILAGSDTVKLFIVDNESGVIGGVLDAYRDFMRNSA